MGDYISIYGCFCLCLCLFHCFVDRHSVNENL